MAAASSLRVPNAVCIAEPDQPEANPGHLLATQEPDQPEANPGHLLAAREPDQPDAIPGHLLATRIRAQLNRVCIDECCTRIRAQLNRVCVDECCRDCMYLYIREFHKGEFQIQRRKRVDMTLLNKGYNSQYLERIKQVIQELSETTQNPPGEFVDSCRSFSPTLVTDVLQIRKVFLVRSRFHLASASNEDPNTPFVFYHECRLPNVFTYYPPVVLPCQYRQRQHHYLQDGCETIAQACVFSSSRRRRFRVCHMCLHQLLQMDMILLEPVCVFDYRYTVSYRPGNFPNPNFDLINHLPQWLKM